MDKTYTCIIFDLDGTLSDSEQGILRSIEHTIKEMKLPHKTRGQLMPFIGAPLKKAFAEGFELTDEKATEAVNVFRAYYLPNEAFKHPPFDGIVDMLKALHTAGKRLAIATSKPTPLAEQVLKSYGVAELFDPIVGSNMDNTRSGKTEVLAYCLSQLAGIDPSEMLMVGDKHYDVNAASNLGIDSAGVLYGYGTAAEMAECKPTYTLKTVADLNALLNK